MNLPSQDFVHCMYLIPESLLSDDSVEAIINLHELLDTGRLEVSGLVFWSCSVYILMLRICLFFLQEFWGAAKQCPVNLTSFEGFNLSIQKCQLFILCDFVYFLYVFMCFFFKYFLLFTSILSFISYIFLCVLFFYYFLLFTFIVSFISFVDYLLQFVFVCQAHLCNLRFNCNIWSQFVSVVPFLL